jgi:hypothetical protein
LLAAFLEIGTRISQFSSPQHHSPIVFRWAVRLAQKSWATTTKTCAVIHMSAIPIKVILLETAASPVVIELIHIAGADLRAHPRPSLYGNCRT